MTEHSVVCHPAKIQESYYYDLLEKEDTNKANCLLWGSRVVSEAASKAELHRDHSRMSRMKVVARSNMWWSGLDVEIKALVRGCPACQSVKNASPATSLQPWTRPANLVHLDFAGPFEGSLFLLAIDAHSKWLEIHAMSSTTVSQTTNVLRNTFAMYGKLEHIVTDNKSLFTSRVALQPS